VNIYEMFGRQAEQVAELRAYFERTQGLLNGLLDGKVSADQLIVTQEGWTLGPERSKEVEPEPTNGFTDPIPLPARSGVLGPAGAEGDDDDG